MSRSVPKALVAATAVGLLVTTACSSKSSSPGASSSGSAGSSTSGQAAGASSVGAATSGAAAPTGGLGPENTNSGGTPVKGGTLHMLGVGDVDFLDPNISYYSTGYLAARLYSRQLVTYPAVAGKATTDVPDLATELPTVANGGISKDGLTYRLTIRTGAKWNTSPARQITAADEVRGVKRTCNPAEPFGGMPDFEGLIAGLADYCAGFAKVDAKSASAIAAYQNSHDISGVTVAPDNPNTVVFTLVHPASFFLPMLSLTAFSPAPAEYDAYIPASAQLQQHTISDGPYEVTKYNPAHEIDFGRNPAWDPSTDIVRKAYVDTVVASETGDQTSIQQQLKANTSSADMEWDTFPPVSQVQPLVNAKDPNFYLGQTFSSNPYIVYNTVSPNNGGALGKVAVRRAISEAISRANLIQDDNGPLVSPPLTHILPAGISGTTSNTSIDLYPYSVAQAKKDLAAAGVTHLTLKFLYRPKSSLASKMFTTLQQDLSEAGITVTGVGVPNADFLTKYLEVPSVAKAGTWDVSIAGWGPDWYGDAATSFFLPLFYGKGGAAFPPNGSDFGFYDNPTVDGLVDQAGKAADATTASSLWAQADKLVMQDSAFFPITSNNQPTYHASHVHNTVFIPALQQLDPANVWLSKS